VKGLNIMWTVKVCLLWILELGSLIGRLYDGHSMDCGTVEPSKLWYL